MDKAVKKAHLIIDVARCQGCNNCTLACKDEHVGNEWPGYTGAQSGHGERWIEVPCRERGQFPLIDVTYRPTLCTHCADAPCVARSGGAISKRSDGVVTIDPRKAAGRRDLVDACPYGRIVWSEESQAAHKCTLCAHLLDEGWTQPRCVQACGPGALRFLRCTDREFAVLAEAEGLETMHGRRLEDTLVCYKNLSRFTDCFIAGSIAVTDRASVECGAGAAVVLRRLAGPDATAPGGTVLEGAAVPRRTAGPAAAAEQTWTATADVFGDFKFDGLAPEGGEYVLTVTLAGYEQREIRVTLGESRSVGTILLQAARPDKDTPTPSREVIDVRR